MTDSVDLRRSFGVAVQAELAAAKLTPIDLAVRADLPDRRVEAILKGSHRRLSLREMSSIAAAIGVPLGRLLLPAGGTVRIMAVQEREKRRSSHP